MAVTHNYNNLINASICEGEEFQGLDTAGEYINNLTTSVGCDSIETIQLIVNPVYDLTNDQVLCFGEEYEGFDSDGSYLLELETAEGCDSIVNLNIEVLALNESHLDTTLCEGYEFEGLEETGLYTLIKESAFGCDSIVHVDFTRYDYFDSRCEFAEVTPNPFSDNLKLIILDQEYMGSTIGLFDMNGRLIFSSFIEALETEFDLAHIPPGSYILNIENGTNLLVIKL